jgi:multidrug resistance efflux pump
MNDESPNETSAAAKPGSLRRRRFPLKIAVSAVVAVVLMGHLSQAVKDRFEAGGAGTILPAKIRAARIFSIVAEAPGSVLSISATLGDKVEPGQELAALEDPELGLAMERAKARLAATEKRRHTLANGGPRIRLFAAQYSAAEAAWKNACSRANDFNTGDPERPQYDAARARTKAIEKLVADGLATSEELERYRREEEDALRTLSAAREHRSRLQQECDSGLTQLRVAQLQRDLNQRSEVDSAEAEYADALAQVNNLSRQSKKLHVIAQRAGTVLSVPVAAGDRITAGAVLFQIGDLSELSVEVSVGGRIARQIHKGDKVLVRLPTDPPRQVEASVSAVLLAPGQDSQSYVVRVVIANPDSSVILAGLEGEVVFRYSDVAFAHSDPE